MTAENAKTNWLNGTEVLVSCDEIAAVGRVTTRAIEGACKRGTIRAVKCGRSWRVPRRVALAYLGIDAAED